MRLWGLSMAAHIDLAVALQHAGDCLAVHLQTLPHSHLLQAALGLLSAQYAEGFAHCI